MKLIFAILFLFVQSLAFSAGSSSSVDANKEYLKAKEFYIQVLSLKGLHIDLYDQAQFKLALIKNGKPSKDFSR